MFRSLSAFLKSAATNRVRKAKPKRTILRLEALEDRRLLSGGSFYTWNPYVPGGGNSWTWTDGTHSNWTLFGGTVRASDWPGSGSGGSEDIASFGAGAGNCTLSSNLTIGGFQSSGWSATLTLNGVLTDSGYIVSGSQVGSFSLVGNTSIVIGSQDTNGHGLIIRDIPAGNGVWRSGSITDTSGGGDVAIEADSTGPCELDITGVQPPAPAQSPPSLGASMVISGNSSTNTATVSLFAMTGSTGSNLQVTTGITTPNSITVDSNGTLIFAQSNTTTNANKYGGIDFATQQTNHDVIVDGGSLLRTLSGGGSVEISNTSVLVKNSGTVTIGNGSTLHLVNSADTNNASLDLESGGTLTINDTGATNGRLEVDHDILVHGGSMILFARTGAVTNLIQGISGSTPTITVEGDGVRNGWLYVESTASLTTPAYATVAANVVFGSNGYYVPWYYAGTGSGGIDVVAELSALGNVTFNSGSFVDLYTKNSTQPDKTRNTPILQCTGTLSGDTNPTYEDQGTRNTDTFSETVTGTGTKVLNTKCTGP